MITIQALKYILLFFNQITRKFTKYKFYEVLLNFTRCKNYTKSWEMPPNVIKYHQKLTIIKLSAIVMQIRVARLAIFVAKLKSVS